MTSKSQSAPVPSHESDTAALAFAKRRTALVVDDEPLVAQFLADTLEDMEFDVVQSPTVAAALTAITSSDQFTIAFVDLGLPDRSGLELISELKQLQPNLPVLITTGYGNVVPQDVQLNNDSPKFLVKPFTATAVAKALSEMGIVI